MCIVARHGKGDPRGNGLASFLVTSWDVPRSDDKNSTPNARTVSAQGEAVEEVVKNFKNREDF